MIVRTHRQIFNGDPRFSFETPDFHWRPQIFIWDPRFSLDTPDFHCKPQIFMGNPRFSLETPDFHGRPQIFMGTPDFHRRTQIFIGDPRFSLDTPIFLMETQILGGYFLMSVSPWLCHIHYVYKVPSQNIYTYSESPLYSLQYFFVIHPLVIIFHYIVL